MSEQKELNDNIEECIKKIIDFSIHNNMIMMKTRDIEKIIHPTKLSKYISEKYKYDDWTDYFRMMGIHRKNDLLLHNKYISCFNLSYENLINLINQFKSKNNNVIFATDFKLKNNLPSCDTVTKILKDNNISKIGFYNNIGIVFKGLKDRYIDERITEFENQVLLFKSECIKKGSALTASDLKNDKRFHKASWLVGNCPDKTVNTYNKFIIWCGIMPSKDIPKQMVIDKMLEKQRN